MNPHDYAICTACNGKRYEGGAIITLDCSICGGTRCEHLMQYTTPAPVCKACIHKLPDTQVPST